MRAYMARRMLLAGFTVWVISILSFFIIQLPEGDSATKHIDRLMMAGDPVSMQMVDNLRD